jgi:asparagine synthase (glutamine-hydrolysing)
MCGIAGVIAKSGAATSLPRLKKATRILSHRGPEEESFWMNEESTVAFGHRRLCIIDLSKKAAQPMHYAGRYTITYNGELYNYTEIKKELEVKGHQLSPSLIQR